MEKKTEIAFPDPDLGPFSTDLALLTEEDSAEHQNLKRSSIGDAFDSVSHVVSAAKKGVKVFGGDIPTPISVVTKGVNVVENIANNNSGDMGQDIVAGTTGAVAEIAVGSVGLEFTALAVEALLASGGNPYAALVVGVGGLLSSTKASTEIGKSVTSFANTAFDSMRDDPEFHIALSNDNVVPMERLPIMPSSLKQKTRALSVSESGSFLQGQCEKFDDVQALLDTERLMDELTVAIQTLPHDIQKEIGIFPPTRERSNALQQPNPLVKKRFGSTSEEPVVSSEMKHFIELLDQSPQLQAAVESNPQPKSSHARIATPKRKRAEQPQEDPNYHKKAKIYDIEAETIAEKFEKHGEVQVLYRAYLEKTQQQQGNSQAHEQALVEYKLAVKEYADDRKCNQVWQSAIDKGTTVLYQISDLSHSEEVRDTAMTVAAMNNLWKAKDEFSNASALWQTAKTPTEFGSAFESSLGTVGMVLSAVSLVVSLLSKKKAQNQVDYSAKTYFAVMEMWKEMREQFQIMQKNFEETWRQLGRMDAVNETRFRMLSEAIEKNQIAIERQITQLSHSMHERFNALDWKLDQIERRNRQSAVLSEFTEMVKLSNSTLTPSDSAHDCHEKAHLLLSQLGDAGSLQEKFSGCRIGIQTEESEQQRVIEGLHHPAFSLTVLGSYLNAVVPTDKSLYSHSQMRAALFQIAIDKTKYICLDPKGIADCVKRADWLKTLSELKPEQKVFVPFDFFGSWLLLVAHRTPTLHIDIFGLQGSVEESAQWLQPYFQAFGIRFKAYPDDVMSNQSSLYMLWLIEQITQEKIQLESAEPLPFSKEAVDKRRVGDPKLEEQQWGNPYVDTWMALHLQRTLALYHDNRKNALTAVPLHIIDSIDKALRRLTVQSQLLTRMQHPKLYRALFKLYREACVEFDSVFEQWSLQAARQIEKDENVNIRQKMLAMEGVVSPIEEVVFGVRTPIQTDYENSNWWAAMHWWQAVYVDQVNEDKWYAIPSPESVVESKKFDYVKKMSDMYRDNIQLHLDKIQSIRVTYQPKHEFISMIHGNGYQVVLNGMIFPQILVPKTPGNPYLRAPEGLAFSLDEILFEAYQQGLVSIRFTYEIVNEKFIIEGLWIECDQNEDSHIFSKKEYAYDPLFYKGNEAILGFWYGGSMPNLLINGLGHPQGHLRGSTVPCQMSEYAKSSGLGNPWPTVRCTRWQSYMSLPRHSQRSGAIKIDYTSKSDLIHQNERAVQRSVLGRLLQRWTEYLETQFSNAILTELSNNTTPLAKAAMKMDQSIHLLQAYLNTLAFAHQDDVLYFEMKEQLSHGLFDSQSLKSCLLNGIPGASIQAFKHMRVTSEKIDALEDWVIDTIHNLPASHQNTPFAIASSLLHQVLRERTEFKRQPNLNMRIQMLDQYIMGMRNQVENVFRNLGDSVYNNVLRSSLRDSAEHCARLSGQIEAIQTSEHQDLHMLMMNQHKLKKTLHELDRMIQRVQSLVDQHILSESTLSYLLTQQSIMRDYYNRMEYQLADAAEEFDGHYYAHDYVPQLERFEHDEPTDSIDDLDALRDVFVTEVQEKTHALSASMGISLSETLPLIKTLNRFISESLDVEEGVVFIGPSKNGKSTTINFSHGCLYTAKKDKKRGVRFREHIQGDEIAVVGHGNASQTTIPLITSVVHNKLYALVDMPGFEDNRRRSNEAGISPYEISTAVSFHLIAKKIQKIRCLNVCVAQSLFNNSGFPPALQQTFQQVGRIILGRPRLRKNIKLLITKYSEYDLKEEIINQVIASIKDFSDDPLFQNDPGMAEFFQLFQDENSAKQHIVLVDVIDEAFREQLYAHWDSLL